MTRRAWATVVLAFSLFLPAACGSEDGAGGAAADGSTDDEAAIQVLFADYNSAFDSGGFADVCAMNTEQFNEELVTEFREAVGDPAATCPMALETMSVASPAELTLDDVEVSDDTAEGQVGPSTWRFARIDGLWKVAYAN
jgi:hypothetical protein